MRNNSITIAISHLRALLGERLSTNHSVREAHGRDESWHPVVAPDAVCFPESADEVAAIVRICAERRVPVIAFGAGTGMEGQVVATKGGICVDLSRLDQILEVNPQDFDCTVQAGTTREKLNEHLRDTGLFFSVDPGANATIGGMAATRASGTTSLRYGTMRENVLNLRVVLPDGRIIRTASRARKSAAGLDLTHLFVGSEGILGIIVEVSLRLHPVPECIAAARVHFPGLPEAVDAVSAALAHALPLARMELMDATQIGAINLWAKTKYPELPTLFIEFHGNNVGVEYESKLFGELCAETGGTDFCWTTNTEERSGLWFARHNAAYAAMALRPGASAIAGDVCVPLSRLSECLLETCADAKNEGTLTTMLAGHVGDGNFHMVFLVDRDNPDEIEAYETLNARMIERALAMDGTCTGEHGIGIGKQQYLRDEFGDAAVGLMQSIKHAIDPDGIMNPGKKLPAN